MNSKLSIGICDILKPKIANSSAYLTHVGVEN